MAWWWWVLIWLVLLAGAGLILFVLGRSLYRKAKLLLSDIGEVSDRLVAAGEPRPDAVAMIEPAVFTDPSRLRAERALSSRRGEGRHSAGTGAHADKRVR